MIFRRHKSSGFYWRENVKENKVIALRLALPVFRIKNPLCVVDWIGKLKRGSMGNKGLRWFACLAFCLASSPVSFCLQAFPSDPFGRGSKSLDFDGGLPPVPAELNYKRTMYIISLYLKECN